jgi:hypothetical protein
MAVMMIDIAVMGRSKITVQFTNQLEEIYHQVMVLKMVYVLLPSILLWVVLVHTVAPIYLIH